MPDTYVMFTTSGYEHRVIQELKNFVLLPEEDAWCPMRVLVKRIHGRDQEVQSNLYPGYIFLKTNSPLELYTRGKNAKGKYIHQHVHILRNDDYILPISSSEEETLNQLCGRNHKCDISYGYAEGKKIIITAGPLQNFTGEICKINRHKKTARIVTRFLDREINLTVGLEIVKKSGESVKYGSMPFRESHELSNVYLI